MTDTKISAAPDINSIQMVEQSSTPATPSTGLWRAYIKSDGLYLVDDAGVVYGPILTPLTVGSGGTQSDLSATGPGALIQASAGAAITVVARREVLTGNRTYYVRTDGSDSNDGLTNSSGGAWLTIQKAIDYCAANLDFGGYTVTVQVIAGTYTGTIAMARMIGMASVASFIIQGDSSATSDVVISTTSANAITVDGPGCMATFRYMKVQTTTSGVGFYVSNFGYCALTQVNFGAIATFAFLCVAAVVVFNAGNFTISGGTLVFFEVINGGVIFCESVGTITLTGTPGFVYFAETSNVSTLRVNGNTFSGAATGARYNAVLNSVIFTNGGGASYLPGDSAGSTATGGQYN